MGLSTRCSLEFSAGEHCYAVLCGTLLAQDMPPKPSDKTSTQNRETVYKVGKDGVTALKALYVPNPEFSEQARQAKYQGIVTLMATVSAR